MGRPAEDRNQCRYCHQVPPAVRIPLVRGVPRGLCSRCRNLQDRSRRWKARALVPDARLELLNRKVLADLRLGTFELIFQPAMRPSAGYLLVAEDKVTVLHLGVTFAMEYSITVVASFLADRGLFLSGNTSGNASSIAGAA